MTFNARIKHRLNGLLKKKGYRIVPIKKSGPSRVDFEYDLKMLISAINPLCLDVGANIGQSIDEFSSWLDDPIIHSFEPSSKIYEMLSKRKQDAGNSWKNIHLYPLALGDEIGDVSFNNYQNSFLNSVLKLEDDPQNPFRGDIQREDSVEVVPISTVDQFLKHNAIDKVDLLKIDTQGFDLQVLKGAEKSLSAGHIDFVYLEMNFLKMYEGQASASQFIEYLCQYDLKPIGFYDGYGAGNSSAIAWCSTLFGKV